jgi:pimeloyl-ACP methyl ester carboxylesterase
MPTLNRPDGAEIQYEVKGNGPNHVLLLSPGGMWSSRNTWNISPYNPWMDASLAANFTLIGMDQRMSRHGNLSDDHDIGWETFRDDQIALLDHLNVEKCHILGSCIGPSFGLKLLHDYPDRFERAVLMQPIGLHEHTTEVDKWEGLSTSGVDHWFDKWADEMVDANRASKEAVDKLKSNMFGTDKDFIFSCTRKDVTAVKHPLLVLAGVDIYHPSGTAREIARLAPNARLIEGWRNMGPKALEAAVEAIKSHLLHGTT